jgi:hypothetical protein
MQTPADMPLSRASSTSRTSRRRRQHTNNEEERARDRDAQKLVRTVSGSELLVWEGEAFARDVDVGREREAWAWGFAIRVDLELVRARISACTLS